ncbi:unnamed protein product [Closterium sp. Yama58-4]|nr:unnamed protein product [Closterium sp. Yama58-4]
MYRHRDQEDVCLAPQTMSTYNPLHAADEFTIRSPDSISDASLDRNSGGGSVHGEDPADRLIFSSYAERSSSIGGSGDGGSRGSGSGHGSPSSNSSYLQHRDLHRLQQGGFPPSLAAERRDPRTNRVGGANDGRVYAAEIEYGYERYSHPGAKSGAIAAGGGNYSQVASRGGSGRASGLCTQRWSYDSPATFRSSEYTAGSGSRAPAAAAGNRARYGKAGAETGSSSDLRFGARGGIQGAGTRRTEFSGSRGVYPTAEHGHATNDTEGWWRDGNRYGREVSCGAGGTEAVIMTGQGGRYLTAQSPESSREAARVMALLSAAVEDDEDAAHTGVDSSGSGGTGLAKTSHMASAKSVVAIMAAVIVVLVLLPACLSDVGPPPAELMLVPVVVMLLLLTLILTPTISSFPARSHPS